MRSPQDRSDIGVRAQIACLLEVVAPKPGNVHPGAGFRDTGIEHYLASAAAIGPAMSRAADRGVGETIRDAVRATRRHVRTNTNLGIALLFAPLAKAAADAASPLRDSLRRVLKRLTVEDAIEAYAAIREAKPGSLGSVEREDVRDRPNVSLLEAMALAADRDSIAREYVTDFAITFERAAPAVRAARQAGLDWSGAIVQAFLDVLAEVPDSLIARKLGIDAAREASRGAAEVLARGGMHTGPGRRAIARLDQQLRDPDNLRNPGTTADLIAAALFVILLDPDEAL